MRTTAVKVTPSNCIENISEKTIMDPNVPPTK